jgi:hypothetical protein
LPYEEDKKVNINSEKSETDGPIENNDLEEGKSAPGPDHAVAPGPSVGPELDQSRTSRQEAAKKIEELFHHTENRLNQIDGQLEQLPKMVQNVVVQVLQKLQEEQTKAGPGAGPTEEFSKMGKEEKMMMLAEFGKSLSEVISAWKGGSAEGQAAGPDFKNIMADWGMKMFTFHLDNMAQSVYQIKLPPPPGIAERSLGPKAQPNFQNPIRPGVHKFE